MAQYPNRLARLRTAQSLSTTQLAAALDVHVNTVTRWEQGQTAVIPHKYWATLSEMFGVSVAYLLGFDGENGNGNGEAIEAA